MTIKLDREILQDFEEKLDPARKTVKDYKMEILGYGEISTVIRIHHPNLENIALKRIPGFTSKEEAEEYGKLFEYYHELLHDAGIVTPDYGWTYIIRRDGKIVMYLAQTLLPSDKICNIIIRRLNKKEALNLIRAVILEISKLWKYNERNPSIKIALDSQISNWAQLYQTPSEGLLYIDTSTPMIRINGVEQLNTRVFLKSAPPLIRTLLKLLFLQDILDRYYDPYLTIVDLIANLIKEKRADLVSPAADLANETFKELGIPLEKKFDPDEIIRYYKSDARIWTIYLSARKIHRSLLKIFGMRYEYLLPDKIERY